MNTPFFEYYISVYDKCGLFLAYGKKMSIDTFTMDGVNMISDNDPNYQIQDLLITDNVLDNAGFYKLSTRQYDIPALRTICSFTFPSQVIRLWRCSNELTVTITSNPTIPLLNSNL